MIQRLHAHAYDERAGGKGEIENFVGEIFAIVEAMPILGEDSIVALIEGGRGGGTHAG